MTTLAENPYEEHLETGEKKDKKRRHQVTEQKGRQKINDQILDLKNLLPECRYVMTTKASILECGVATIKRLQALSNTLTSNNRNLVKENKKLHAELNRIRESGIFVNSIASEDEGSDENGSEFSSFVGSSPLLTSNDSLSMDPLMDLSPFESPFDSLDFTSTLLNPAIPTVSSNYFLKNVTNIMESVSLPDMIPAPFTLSNPDSDPFFLDYCSSPLISSTSPHSSNSPYSTDSFSPFNSPDQSDTDFDPSSFTRFTKRRLMFVFLFMIPMFVTFQKGTLAGDFVASGTTRTMLAPDTYFPTAMEGWDFIDLWNIIRTIWYIVGGMAGAGWIFNTFMWANKLNEEYSYTEKSVPTQKPKKESNQNRKKKAFHTTRRPIVM